jgi:hypothetical protein
MKRVVFPRDSYFSSWDSVVAGLPVLLKNEKRLKRIPTKIHNHRKCRRAADSVLRRPPYLKLLFIIHVLVKDE